jgi:hypothetical protein
MEVMVAVQSGTLLHALRVQLKRRVSARRGGDYNEVPSVRFRSLRVALTLRVKLGIKVQIHLLYWKFSSLR